jgi:hypothetical protein
MSVASCVLPRRYLGGFVLGLALRLPRLLQDHYGYTVKNDGWLKVYQNVKWPSGYNCHQRKAVELKKCGV